MARIKIKGQTFNVSRSNQRKGKKFKATPINGGPSLFFGASGMKIKPGTKAGDNYCARSSGIKSKSNKVSANDLSRAMWNCKGKKSVSKKFKL